MVNSMRGTLRIMTTFRGDKKEGSPGGDLAMLIARFSGLGRLQPRLC